uniref:dedicator of cytokinesis protein 1-like isoform X2 n=1 Tax=Myxine glutinosa TaxID=7769 RepID=UPI00358E8DE8
MSTPRKMSVVSRSREWLNIVGEDSRSNAKEKRGSRHCEVLDREVKPVEPQAAADVFTLSETITSIRPQRPRSAVNPLGDRRISLSHTVVNPSTSSRPQSMEILPSPNVDLSVPGNPACQPPPLPEKNYPDHSHPPEDVVLPPSLSIPHVRESTLRTAAPPLPVKSDHSKTTTPPPPPPPKISRVHSQHQ